MCRKRSNILNTRNRTNTIYIERLYNFAFKSYALSVRRSYKKENIVFIQYQLTYQQSRCVASKTVFSCCSIENNVSQKYQKI